MTATIRTFLAAFAVLALAVGAGCKKNVKTDKTTKTTKSEKTGPSEADLRKAFFPDLTVGFLTSGGVKEEDLLAIVQENLKGKGTPELLQGNEGDIQQLRKVFLELYGEGERVPIRLVLNFDYPKNIKAAVLDLDRRFNVFIYTVGKLGDKHKQQIVGEVKARYVPEKKEVKDENFVYEKMKEGPEGARGFPYTLKNLGNTRPFWITKQDTSLGATLYFVKNEESPLEAQRVTFNLTGSKAGISGTTITPNNIGEANDPPKEFLYSSLKIVLIRNFTGNLYEFHHDLIKTTELKKIPNRYFEIAKKKIYLSYDIGPGGAGGIGGLTITLEGAVTVRGGQSPEWVKVQVTFADGSKDKEVDLTGELLQSGDNFKYKKVLNVKKNAVSYELRYKLKGINEIKKKTVTIQRPS